MGAWDLSEALGGAVGGDALWTRGLAELDRLGFPRAIYVRCASDGSVALRSNCDEAWIADHRRDMRAGREPFVHWCLSTYRSIPTGSDHLSRYAFLRPADRDVIMDARDRTGLRAGRSITIRARGEGTLAASGWHLLTDHPAAHVEAQFAEHGKEIALVCHMLAARLGSSVEDDAPGRGAGVVPGGLDGHDEPGVAGPGPVGARPDDAAGGVPARNLSPRERECLQFVASGMRVAEIAHRLALSEKTVDLHLANARKRLGARTRDEAVARAVMARAIAP